MNKEMCEKVLGFKEKDALESEQCLGIKGLRRDSRIFYNVYVDKLVPVVSIEWLEKYVKHIRGCFEKNQPSDFEAGEETGRIEGLEVLLAEAKKEARK